MAGGATTSAAAGDANIATTSAAGGGVNKVSTNAALKVVLSEQARMTSPPLNSTMIKDYADHYHGISSDFFLHKHNVSIDIPSHQHSVSVSVPAHSHNVPAHSHTIGEHYHTLQPHTHSMPPHSHTIDTTHRHDLEYSIFEQQSKCSNVKVYVNNVLVNGGAGINSDVDLDITRYIRIGQRNDIRIETDSNGRINCNLFTKSFVAF